MEIEVAGSRGNTYTIDTEKVSCTCADFRFRCCHNQITSEARQCKHLRQVFKEHPEYMPDEVARAMKRLDDTIEKVSNKKSLTFPSAIVESYVSLIKSFINWEMTPIGSYAQGKSECEDLTFIVKKSSFNNSEIESISDFIGTVETIEEDKIVILADGYFPVIFLIIDDSRYLMKLFFGTNNEGVINKIIERANSIGYLLTPEGLIEVSTGKNLSEDFKSISDLYKTLDIKPENLR